MCVNGYWGKWALGVNAHLGERGTPSALCLFIPNVYKWALGQMDIWGKGHPKCPVPISPKFCKWAVEKIGFGDPSAHLPQCPFCPSAHLGDMGTGHLDYPFTQLSICPVSICKNLGRIGTGHLGCSLRPLGVLLSPKCLFAPNAHFPHCLFEKISENEHRAPVIPR